MMQTFLSVLWSIISTLVSLLWWVASTLVWITVWFLLPFLLVAFIALRLAERAFGEKSVRDWVKMRATRLGAGTWDRVRPWLFALGVLPFRVLVWFVVYAVWHAVVSLFWRPRWKPWQRAWAKRWKGERANQSGQPVIR